MRLTVGPLPAAVYWRRRTLVLAGVAMVALVVVYACNGPDASGGGLAPAAAQTSAARTPAPPTSTVQTPTVPTASPQPTAFSLPYPGATGPCADDELAVSASAASAQVQRGQALDVTIRIKNISGRTCVRDLGAEAQELRLRYGGDLLVWSSDDCHPSKGTDPRSLEPNKETSFTLTWDGRRSRTGADSINCAAPAPDAGGYQLVARLDKKLSAPFELRVVD